MRIPSIQALKALESFARHGSVWKAADELGLTRSAVSHQLRLLERELGFGLLQKRGRGIALTVRGRRYAGDIGKALAAIGEAANRHGDMGVDGALVVSCTPGFASLWLCTHIDEFQAGYPDIALRIVTPRELGGVSDPDVDAFIAFGDGDWPGKQSELLSEVNFTPMCSPALLNRIGPVAEPRDILRMRLLHLVTSEDWRRWFSKAGVDMSETEGGIVFSDMNLVLSAAAAGQGVAMGDELTCAQALADGQLVRPWDLSIRAMRAYHLVMDSKKAGSLAMGAFRQWLRTRLDRDLAAMTHADRRAMRE